jgi:hypothetical protein
MATLKLYAKFVSSLYSQDASYATAVAGPADGVFNSGDGQNGQTFTGSVYRTFIGYADFDTSVLAGIGTISSAVLKTVNALDTSTTDFTSNVRLYDFGATLDNADWLTPAQMTTKTLLATYNTSSGFTGTVSYTDVALLSNINTSGSTRLVFSSSRYESSIAPSGNEYYQPYRERTYIEITYSGTPTTPVTFISPDTTDNGYIQSTSNTSYASARTGEGLAAVDSSSGSISLYFGQNFTSFKGSPTYDIFESFVRFDTSSLSGLSLLTAELRLYFLTDLSTTNFEMQARLHTWGTALTTADWVAGASLSTKTLLASLNTSGITTGSYYTFIDTALLANLNTTGFTDIILVSKNTVDGTTATQEEYVLSSANVNGFAIRLVVTFTPPTPPPAGPNKYLTLLGVG